MYSRFLALLSGSFLIFGGFMFLTQMSIIISFSLLGSGSFPLFLEFVFDQESLIFASCVSWIASVVFFYSFSYMQKDVSQERFFMLLLGFVVSMLLLVFSGNFFSVMIGWDGLGVSSFFLVIYFQNKSSLNAGLITILTNRLGDVFLLVCIVFLLSESSWSLSILSCGGYNSWWGFYVMLLGGAFTKSAQVPFSSWLPAAMAAPTPVSSLVHSSTLVTAGVYLLFRFKGSLPSGALFVMLFFGSLTMCMAGLGGLIEKDFKKMVALSTLSQLGLMVSSLGLGGFALGFFHLLTHAFFKALLFLGVGSLIHSANGYQDLRFLGLKGKFGRRTKSIVLTCNASLMGFPFLAGFYSKDLILELSLSSSSGLLCMFLFFVGTGLTVMYSFRLMMLSSGGKKGLKVSVCYSKSDRNMSFFRSYDRLFWLAVMSGSGLNYLYLKHFPSLVLSLEAKNLTFLIICLSVVLGMLSVIPLRAQMIKRFALKWSVSSLWGLIFLSPMIGKYAVFQSSLLLEKIADKKLSKSMLFELGVNQGKVKFSVFTVNSTSAFFMGLLLCFFFLYLF